MLTILDNGLCIEDGKFRYAWYRISADDGAPYYRCVAIKQLDAIPVAVREDYNLLGKMWGAMRGLYNAGVNFVAANAGIFNPDHIGLVQYFGAAGEGSDETFAATEALRGMATVEGVMANFHQSRLIPPNADWLRWYLEFITDHGHFIAALLGHPDPRQGRGTGTKDGAIGDASKDDLALEQNEILFRGLAKLRQNFVFQVLAEHVNRPQLTGALVRIAEMASIVASRRKGAINIGFSLGIPLMAAVGQSLAASQGASQGTSQGVSQSAQHSLGTSHQVGQAHTESQSVSHTEGKSWSDTVGKSVTDTQSHSVTDSQSVSASRGTSEGVNAGLNGGLSLGGKADADPAGVGIGLNGGANVGGSLGGSLGWNQSQGWSQGRAETVGQAHSVGSMQSHSAGGMVADSVSHGSADTSSEAWGTSEGYGQGYAQSLARSQALSQALTHGVTGSLSTGLMPGFNIGRSWQTEDDVADRLTEVLRKLEGLVNTASAEGGFMANALIFTESMEGASAADALAPQAFHGPDVATPILTIAPLEGDEPELRAHALAFLPWRGGEEYDPLSGALWTRYATLLTASQMASLTAPALFEEGVAATVMAPIPHGMGFIPNMPGDVVIGHQYSPETADLTTAQVRLSPDMFMHTLYAGDTGFGKSVAAIRTVYETTQAWNWRTIVLDFGAGWRQLLNAPGTQGRVNILQLWPDAVRPMRWNPLQIGRMIAPETQWRAFADVFGSITQLGVKRQKQELLEALRICYIRTGVLIDDPQVRADPQWGKVQYGEESALVGVLGGTPLSSLTAKQRQALAVQRSSVVGLVDLYAEVEAKLKSVPPRDTMLTGVLEGILFRMNPLVQGAAAVQFSPGKDCVPVEDLSKPNGITIIEGGMFLDEFGKAFLLGWVGWHTYMDRVATRVHEVHMTEPMLHIVYEEANKIFGQQQKGGGDDGGGADIADQYGAQFRDARKYGVRFSVIAQAPALIAPDIVSSCSNLVINYLKNPKDKDLVLSALARSEKGFRDEEWRRFVDDMGIGMAIGRFPYTPDRRLQRSILFRPLMLDVPEPTDDEIAARLGRIAL
ncbi:MAG: serine-rich protein [Anaerolineales bacterium]